MLFSIIIPVYNVEKYLFDCLDSVRNQTFADWEAICVDDGSTDDSAIVLEAYANKDGRMKVVTQANGGLSAARNAGLRQAKGDYVLFLDSDDWLERNALEVLSQNLDDEDMLCFSGRRYFDDGQAFKEPDRLKRKTYSSGMGYYNENALQPRDFAFVCVVLRAYKRTFLLEQGLWFKEGIYHEDNLFTPKACFYAEQVRQIEDSLYNYRVRQSSITTTANGQRLRDMLTIANELAAFFIPRRGFGKAVVYRAITHHYQVVFMNASTESRQELKNQCNWSLYRTVSRTKLRHKVNYWKNKLG